MEDMSLAISTEVTLILLLLLLSGMFSSSEVVFFSISKPYMLRFSNHRFFNILMKILQKPKETLISILIGNEIVNVLLSAYGAKVFTEHFGNIGALISAFLISFLIFIFGETIPKNLVLVAVDRLSLIYAPLFYPVHVLLTPFRYVLVLPARSILKMFNIEIKEEKFILSEEKIIDMMEAGLETGEFSTEEKDMVEKVLKMEDTLVREIMTSKPDIFALPEDKKIREVIDIILEKGHSKIPVYKENPDNITGFVYVKDWLPLEENLDKKLSDFKKEVIYVPEIMPVSKLLQELKSSKTQVAIVVDEHGAVSGMITLYDILEWLVGNVPTEWEDSQEIVKLSANMYRVDGSASIEEVAKELGFELPEDYDYDTISGFIMANLGKVPEEGDSLTYGNFKFIVNEMEGNRVKEVIVKVPVNGQNEKETTAK